MDRALAEAAARNLLGDLASQGTVDDWDAAFAASVTPDLAGRWPTHVDWVPSYDFYWVAAEVADALALRAMTVANVVRWTSEGTSVETKPAELVELAAKLRTRSSIPTEAVNLVGLATTAPAGGYDPRSGSWPGTGSPGVVGNWS